MKLKSAMHTERDMVAVASHSIAQVLTAPHEEGSSAFMQFFGELCAAPIVRMVGVSDEGIDGLQVWVRLDVDDDEQEEGLYRSLQMYRATGHGVPVDLHVVLAMQPDAVFPSDAHVLYVRQ